MAVDDPKAAEFLCLPQEIIDDIVDHLGTDRSNAGSQELPWYHSTDALLACTLVCRKLLPRSSKYGLENIAVQCIYDPRDPGSTDVHLRRLLLHAESSSRLASNVSALRLVGRPTEDLVGRAVRRLTNLCRLYFSQEVSHLHDIIDVDDRSEGLSQPLCDYYSINRLDFDSCYVRSALRYLTLFQSVHQLRFGTVWFKARDLQPAFLERLVPQIMEYLFVDSLVVGTSDACILRLIQPMLAPGSLRRLSFEDLVTNACNHVEPFLENSCSGLASLRVRMKSCIWDSEKRNADLKKVLDLSHCCRLSELELVLQHISYTGEHEPLPGSKFLEFACSFVLGNLPSSVKHIRLQFEHPAPDLTDHAYSSTLTDVTKRLCSSTTVHFEVVS